MSGIWYNKYRPATLDDYVWKTSHLRDDIESWVKDPSIFRHLVLAGPYGTGKTTLAIMMQDLLGLDSSDYLFINSGLKGGIETIRQDIVNHCENAGWSGIKVVVLDEADNLSHAAQESLKGVMDAYGEYTRFIFTTNRLSGISDALRSRCRTIMIDQMDMQMFIDRIVEIAQEEEIFDEDSSEEEALAIQEIIDLTYPDMRKAIQLLQDSVRNGKVCKPSMDDATGTDWEEFVVDTLASKRTVDQTRQELTGFRKGEMEDIYRFLYEHAEELFENPYGAIVLIAEYLDRHSRSAFPDITLAALLLKLQET